MTMVRRMQAAGPGSEPGRAPEPSNKGWLVAHLAAVAQWAVAQWAVALWAVALWAGAAGCAGVAAEAPTTAAGSADVATADAGDDGAIETADTEPQTLVDVFVSDVAVAPEVDAGADAAEADADPADPGAGDDAGEVADVVPDVAAETAPAAGAEAGGLVDAEAGGLVDAEAGGLVDAEAGGLVDADTDTVPAQEVDAAVQTADAVAPAKDATAADVAVPKPIDPAVLPLAAMVDVTSQYGFDPKAMMGMCIAVADFDGNGRQDFVVVRLVGFKAYIHAVLLGPGAAKHVESVFDTSSLQPNFGCSAADMDGDAKPDLLFGGFSGAALYLGDGAGKFVDQSPSWMPYIMDFAAFSVAPVDLDGDGDLDVFVGAGSDPPPCDNLKCQFTPTDLVCEVIPPMPLTAGVQDRVLIQNDSMALTDETKAWKVPPGGTQTVVLPLDVDSDGKMDMLVGDDFGGSRLLYNTGKAFKTFDTDIGLHVYSGSMGWTVGDFNSDGLADVVLAESGPMPLYSQVQPKPGNPVQFVDDGGKYGTWSPMWGASAWSPLVADFDHNGHDDVLVGVSVHISAEKSANIAGLCDASKQNSGAGLFDGQPSIDVLFLNFPGQGMVPYRLVTGAHSHIIFLEEQLIDLDGDGDLDVVQTRPGPEMMPTSLIRILRNDLPKQGKQFTVVVKGKGANQDALGTTITAKIGGVSRKRWLNGSGGFGGTPSRFAHFGLGAAAKATEVTVTWPDGKKTLLGDGLPGATLTATWP